MEESKYTKEILVLFDTTDYKINKLYKLNWNRVPTQKLKLGFVIIDKFKIKFFVNLAKLVLSGDHLVCEISDLDTLLGKISEDEIVLDNKNTPQDELKKEYAELHYDIRDLIYLVKYHKNLTIERFNQHKDKELIRVTPYKSNRSDSKYVSLLDDICNVCWFEHIFSFDKNYIRDLLMLYEKLKKRKNEENDVFAKKIINATINKIEFLLKKLTVFSKNKSIKYNYEFHESTINLSFEKQYKEDDFRGYFLDFMDIERIPLSKIGLWQETLYYNKNVKMWHFIFLMRHYVEVTKSKEQINKLIAQFETHYEEKLKDTENIVDKFAYKSGINYMYNSRFSYYCKNEKGYAFTQMKTDLDKIESLQNETFIFNYHPYQKAIEFANRHLTESIEKNESIDVLNQILSFIKDSFKKFKNNVEWCNTNQPYLLQLSFNFSKIKEQDIEVFYPSAFCRPLRFQKLHEDIQKLDYEINMLDYQVKHHSERLEILKAKQEIENMQEKNNELLTRYASIATFLVGLLSIFIGNKEEVSIFTKMEYVVALGVILIMFVSVGYFFTSESFKKFRTFVFVLITVASILYIGSFTFQTIQHHHTKESANNNFTYNNTKCKNDTVCKGHQTDTRNK